MVGCLPAVGIDPDQLQTLILLTQVNAIRQCK